jgi:hypothetical protein
MLILNVSQKLQSNQLPAAGNRADNSARRRKHIHIHVGLTKTSMFWILADSSTPVIFISSIWHCWKRHLRAKTKAGSPITDLGG